MFILFVYLFFYLNKILDKAGNLITKRLRNKNTNTKAFSFLIDLYIKNNEVVESSAYFFTVVVE